ncbi:MULTISPECIES: CBS domain-containing protein [unclassified Streptomyces]|uniref:CBS domain-containing protein n=1 Tax=unclassified Streptomyces TaxID=2593676 RepID=UPI000DC3CA10|nr:CBS domain-containing protein [Streptomyces sp. PsTaAH-137]RAJ77096.1 CBS domain protein [Streptomyces sp. PsTaAH-137]
MSVSPHIVSDVMTHTVVAVGRDALFKDIVELMDQWKVGAVPVLEGESRVVGVVSEADLLPKEEFRDADPDRIEQLHRLSDLAKAGAVSAGELMSSPAVCVRPDATLAEAARIMAHRRVKRLSVVGAGGSLEGIVSRSDLLKVFLRPDEEIAEEVRHTVAAYLFPDEQITVVVADGVVTFGGTLRNRNLVPVAARLARAVEGVVDIRMDFTGPAPAD